MDSLRLQKGKFGGGRGRLCGHAVPGLSAPEPGRRPLLQRMRNGLGGALFHLRPREPGGRPLLQCLRHRDRGFARADQPRFARRARRLAGLGGRIGHGSRADAFGAPGRGRRPAFLHPEAPGRPHPHPEGGDRGRTQACHRALRRSGRFHRAGRAARGPGGNALSTKRFCFTENCKRRWSSD